MIKVIYAIGKRPHEKTFNTNEEFVQWFEKNYRFKILSFKNI